MQVITVAKDPVRDLRARSNGRRHLAFRASALALEAANKREAGRGDEAARAAYWSQIAERAARAELLDPDPRS